MTIIKSKLNLIFWLGMSLGLPTTSILAATCLVCVLFYQDLSFLGFKIHQTHYNGYGTILEEVPYNSLDLGWIIPAVVLGLISLGSFIFFRESIKIFRRIRKENRREKAYLKTLSKNTKRRSRKHKEESIALFI